MKAMFLANCYLKNLVAALEGAYAPIVLCSNAISKTMPLF